jgi:hypothetical protein
MSIDHFAELVRLTQEVLRLKSALSDIAHSEPIPTPHKGWEFCRDIAASALAIKEAA